MVIIGKTFFLSFQGSAPETFCVCQFQFNFPVSDNIIQLKRCHNLHFNIAFKLVGTQIFYQIRLHTLEYSLNLHSLMSRRSSHYQRFRKSTLKYHAHSPVNFIDISTYIN
jgi:hypothetical protein